LRASVPVQLRDSAQRKRTGACRRDENLLGELREDGGSQPAETRRTLAAVQFHRRGPGSGTGPEGPASLADLQMGTFLRNLAAVHRRRNRKIILRQRRPRPQVRAVVTYTLGGIRRGHLSVEEPREHQDQKRDGS